MTLEQKDALRDHLVLWEMQQAAIYRETLTPAAARDKVRNGLEAGAR